MLLAFDTSGPWCAAALVSGAPPLVRVEEMARGQAERLVPLLEALLAEGGARWSDLSAIGVCTGPGNFTGIRIGVSAARGLAMGLGIPAIGVSTFEAVAAMTRGQHMVSVPGPRGMAYLADAAQPEMGRLVPERAAEHAAAAENIPVADRLISLAQVAQARQGTPQPPPTPLYIRPANAAPAKDDGLRLL